MIKRLYLFFFLISSTGMLHFANATLTLQKVRTASKDILVAIFTSDTMNIDETDISDSSQWTLNGVPCTGIFRYITKADVAEHHIYMETSELTEGKEYLLETPYGNKTFTFNEKEIFCESIKTNQAGYSALSKKRYAIFSIWLGTGGSRKINGTPPSFEVFDQQSGMTLVTGNLEEIGNDSSSGDYIYRIDLSTVPVGGPYKIAVKGYGCSYPFGVGSEFTKKTAYILFRGQFYQRCGCPIDSPAIRKNPCHTLVYDVDGPIGEANIEVQGTEPAFSCYGGYHDAGDADRRAYHIANPIINLMIYEAFPEVFFDGQFDIPGEFDAHYNIVSKLNGIPDIIDEAEWGTLVWEYLQNEDGTIHFGTETKGYPAPFAAPMDQDTKKYGTVRVDNRATCPCAGLFLHMARLLKPWKPERSAELINRAEKAFEACSGNMADPEKLYYYIQQYLLNPNEESHQKIRELYKSADSLKLHLFVTNGYSLNDSIFDNPAYFYSYIAAKGIPVDKDIADHFKSLLREAAKMNIAELEKHGYPVGNPSGKGGWGHNVRQPQYACAPLLMWGITKEQSYLDAASQLMDYKLGLNPMGISYVTGLGFHSVHHPHDRESAYTESLGWGPKSGITVFGPGIIPWRRSANIPILPKLPELSKERQYIDDMRFISFNEFTIFETMAHDALYTILAGGGKWNKKDPFGEIK